MRRFLTLLCLLCLTIPAGISISGCIRNPSGNFCNGEGYGLKTNQPQSISLTPTTGGISLAYGQTKTVTPPQAFTCLGANAPVNSLAYTYSTTNSKLVDISPTGVICAGTWNRNTGGGIPNFTICSEPNPLPSTNGLPYGSAYISASAESITSNPVQVFVHAPITSITLVGQSQGSCTSQGVTVALDSQACYAGANGTQYLLCAPPSITSVWPATNLACPLTPLPSGSTLTPQEELGQIQDCTNAIGALTYVVGTASNAVASINSVDNEITAQLPGTATVTASVAGSGSSAGYFTTCSPQSISTTLANGSTSGVVTNGVTQNLTTTVLDTKGNPLTGLALTYQSTNPIDISVGSGGTITTSFPGQASITAICEPSTCNPAPPNEIGFDGTGLSISSNPVSITSPGTASDYVWFAAPGQSQYFTSIELITGTTGSTVRLPYVPNSMVMDQSGKNLFFGSSHELMVYSTSNNQLSVANGTTPGVVLAASPDSTKVLINDQIRHVFYLYTNAIGGGSSLTFGGMGTAAAWTPDSQTLYVVDSCALNTGGTCASNTGPVTGHTDTLYVYNSNTGLATYDLDVVGPGATSAPGGATSLALTVPSVGAYFNGSSSTAAFTWCPSGTVGNASTITYYNQGDDVAGVVANTLGSTPDGQHVLGAQTSGGSIMLDDIGVTIPSQTTPSNVSTPIVCPISGSGTSTQTLAPLELTHTLNQLLISRLSGVTAVNQVVTGSLPQLVTSATSTQDLAFVLYSDSSTTNLLPYYLPVSGGTAGTVNYVTLMNGSSASTTVTGPIAGAFSPDHSIFFVSTAGDNQIHFISIPSTASGTFSDTQQISPNLPACTPVSAGGTDAGCTYTGTGTIIPATVITVKPRTTTT
jgi:hypothetical protein